MDKVEIIKVEITNEKNLLVTPPREKDKDERLYQYIYRMATGVFWNKEKPSFSSPVPREWSYTQWFENILHCAKSELGVRLVITSNRQWINVPESEKTQMIENAK